MFLRKKSNGENRPIFNLKRLNDYVLAPKFRLINQFQIPSHIQRNDYMMKLDISQAYFHVPVRESHRRYLSLVYQNTVYEMTCLPFGLASAPAAFAKITNWVAQQLRMKGLRVIVYLDDFLIFHENQYTLEKQVIVAIKYLKNLGWQVNQTKSSTKPVTRIEYLGVTWDTRRNTKSLSKAKVLQLSNSIKELLRKNRWSWHSAKVILGKLNFASFVVPLGRLHCRLIQKASQILPRTQPRRRFSIPPIVMTELNWWLKNVRMATPIHYPDPSIFITTDAADVGWGAIVNSRHLWGGWNQSQKKWHSNMKELWTVFEVLQRLGYTLQGKTILLQSDNRTSIAYINKQGGTRSNKLLEAAQKILHYCERVQCHLIARHIPGLYNGIADGLSREKALPEWHLSKQILDWIFQELGKPVIDLFASRRSAVVSIYVSEDATDTHSHFTDAFSRTWRYKLGWIFPPPALIPRVLNHLKTSQGQYLVVAPIWDRAFWIPELHRISKPPLLIPNLQENLIDLRTNRPPPGIEHLKLGVWKSSWRKSTLQTYKPIWSRWCQWASKNDIRIDNPDPEDVAKYLCFLYRVIKLAPRTIAVHKSVVANFSNPSRAQELASHPLVRQIIKGIFADKPPIKKPLSWRIEDLINFLKRYELNQDNLFAVSRHTSVLLLLATGRRVHDLTLLTLEKENFEDKGDELIFWPKFGSKTDTTSHRQSGWLLRKTPDASESRLDLVSWQEVSEAQLQLIAGPATAA
ncbi:uncharacterized protein LOC126371606 [Pectinophora gossypiella]|uniref:uncharacterized protein LOC126371606 n=1 Tax=Pectinophora gossypiella TaxID=13191 RepID=UPI00214EF81C|nr:uncharacterized protein LOC126371606 [Pectinophora gossypiella]